MPSNSYLGVKVMSYFILTLLSRKNLYISTFICGHYFFFIYFSAFSPLIHPSSPPCDEEYICKVEEGESLRDLFENPHVGFQI